MEPPAGRARDRHRFSATVSLVSLARRFERRSETPVVADLRPPRAAGRGRLVDGGLRAFRACRRFVLSGSPPADCWAFSCRLAPPLMRALLIFSAIVWSLRRLADRSPSGAASRLKITSLALLVLTFVQLYLGALLAGLRAGRVYNTWPQIDGALIPSTARLFFEEPWWRNLFDNTLTVQFEHRIVAYALFALAILHAVDAVRSRAGTVAVSGALWLAAVVTLQAALGIFTLLNQVPVLLGLAHQAVAMSVLTLAIFQTERLVARQPQQHEEKPGSAAPPNRSIGQI